MWNPFRKKNKDIIIYNQQMKESDSYFGTILNAFARRFSGGTFGVSPNGKRDFNALFGYGDFLSYTDYFSMYKRGGIANVVVAKVAKSCWRDMPKILVDDDEVLEDELALLKNANFFRMLERADILNRIGSFSVMLIGIPDGLELNLPVGSAKKGSFDAMYFNVYGYDGIEILKTDSDPASSRFGLPVLYQLQTIDVDNSLRKQTQIISRIVHYTRIVHLAEGSLDSSIEGTSALEAPWNALTDKEKTRGSSAEAYYRNARQKLALETNDGAKVSTDPKAITALKENVENFQNGLEDVLRLSNMKANMLQPSMASPRDTFDIAVEEVAGTTGIPVRILTTKAGGSVTGSEDKATWNALVNDRQDQECSLYLIDALKVMSEAGIIELPDNVVVKWPVQTSLSEKESSESMRNKAEAFKAATEGLSTIGADEVVVESVFEAIGLDIDIDEIDLSDDENLDKLNRGES